MGMLWVEHDDENDTLCVKLRLLLPLHGRRTLMMHARSFVVFSTEDQAARAEEASKLWVLEDRDSHTTSSIRLEVRPPSPCLRQGSSRRAPTLTRCSQACSVPVSLRNPRPGHRFWPDTTLDPHSPSFAPDDWLRGDAQKSDLWRRLCVEVDNPDGGYSVDPALAPLQPIGASPRPLSRTSLHAH